MMRIFNEDHGGHVGFGGNVSGTPEVSGSTQKKNRKMSPGDQMIYDTLEKAIKEGEAKKIPPWIARFCRRCQAHNAMTDVSNLVLELRKKEIEDKYKDN